MLTLKPWDKPWGCPPLQQRLASFSFARSSQEGGEVQAEGPGGQAGGAAGRKRPAPGWGARVVEGGEEEERDDRCVVVRVLCVCGLKVRCRGLIWADA